MASLYDSLNTYNQGALGSTVMGAGAYTPYTAGDTIGSGTAVTDPNAMVLPAATTAAVDNNYPSIWGGGLTGPGSTTAPNAATQGPGGGNSSTGYQWEMNPDTIGLALGGLKTIAGIWQAWEANKLAKQQLNMQRGLANTNLEYQRTAYNTRLQDIADNRVLSGGWDQKRGDTWYADHDLEKRTV